MNEWMNEWMKWMNEWMSEWMNEMKWNEMKWNDMKWNEMNEMNELMNEMKWNEMKWKEMKGNEMKWNEMKWMNEWMSEWVSEWMTEWMNVAVGRHWHPHVSAATPTKITQGSFELIATADASWPLDAFPLQSVAAPLAVPCSLSHLRVGCSKHASTYRLSTRCPSLPCSRHHERSRRPVGACSPSSRSRPPTCNPWAHVMPMYVMLH